LNYKNYFSFGLCDRARAFAHARWTPAFIPLLTLSIVVLFSFQTALAQDSAAPREPYTINPGDLLEISVWKEPDLQRQVLVRPDGAFSFPLSGDLVAVGRTVEDVRQELTERLSVFIPDLVVTVTVAEINGNKIFVIGQVRTPGEFVVNPRVDVIQALSIAGGMTPFAESNDIKILRRRNGVQTILRFRYNDVIKGQNLEQNILLEVGDVVLVP
jgi:polysaccharide export outer membrane protein